MRSMRVRVLSVAMLLCAAMCGASERPIMNDSPSEEPIAFSPERVQALLDQAKEAQVGPACGTLEDPWWYRGSHSKGHELSGRGRVTLSDPNREQLAKLLERCELVASLHTIDKLELPCDSTVRAPVYMAVLDNGVEALVAILRFDRDEVLFYVLGEPLGIARLTGVRDDLWALLHAARPDDAILAARAPVASRPAPAPPRWVYVPHLPSVLKSVPPVYPEGARQHGISGIVWVAALVGVDGTVHDAYVRAGPAELRDAALDSVWPWTFKPARKADGACAVWVMVPVRFMIP